MKPEQARRWIEGQRTAAAAAAQVEARRPVDPAASWRQALSLLALLGEAVGWPVAPDPVRQREDAKAAAAWARLRAFYGDRR